MTQDSNLDSHKHCDFCEQPIDGGLIIERHENSYCCTGCATAHEMLSGANIHGPGPELLTKYAHLVVAEEAEGLKIYDGTHGSWQVSLPAIHCTSCLLLLERMPEWLEGISEVRVSFSAKRATIAFNPEILNLPILAAWLDYVGYPPSLVNNKQENSNEVTKLGIAGFAMGNAMMSAFPEYFGLDQNHDALLTFFRYSTAFFATISLIVAGRFYLENAYKAVRGKTWSLDIPIAIGMLSLWGWSAVLLGSSTNGGYFDSLSGLIFFLLLGKFIQRKTYAAFSFERTVNDFLPLSVFHVDSGRFVRLGDLGVGDRVELAQGSIIPLELEAKMPTEVDYSFITGESEPILCQEGDTLLMGGKILKGPIRAKVLHAARSTEVEGLWRDSAEQTGWVSPRVTAIFTLSVLVLALGGGIAWWYIDSSRAVEIAVSVLIIACPCALSLAAPFAYGTATSRLSKLGIYLKNGKSMDRLARVVQIAWDKTGTLTGQNLKGELHLIRTDFNGEFKAIAARSAHPISQSISEALGTHALGNFDTWEEFTGKGILATDAQGVEWRIGSGEFCHRPMGPTYLLRDGVEVGNYLQGMQYREELTQVFSELQNSGVQHHLISGDSPRELPQDWQSVFGRHLHFNQRPEDKASLLQTLNQCLFVGDGLNDLEAMEAAEVGLAVVEGDLGYFPKSDGIIFAEALPVFPRALGYSQKMRQVVRWAYLLSLGYNLSGVVLALLGLLSPVIAAVLMPLSSVSVVLFVVLFAMFFAPKS